MTRAEQALALADMGFYVFPLRAKGKTPRHQGWQEKATRDAAAIDDWWSNHPADNIGIFTGRYGDDDGALLVIDVDNKHGKHGDAEIKRLADGHIEIPVTLEQLTPTGGRHLIYTVNEAVRSGTNVLGDGLDVRSAGGYIVAPGSETDVGVYRWVGEGRRLAQADGSVVQLCGRARQRDPEASVPLVDEDQDANVARAVEYLQHADAAIEGAGGDFHTYKVACGVRDLSISEPLCTELMLDHFNERCQPPWDPQALAAKVANAYRYAKEPPGTATVEADFGAKPKEAKTQERRLKSLSPFPTGEPSLDRSYLVKDWLRPGQMSLLVGHSNVGKTFVALDLLLSIARGLPWFGKRTEKRAVAYIAAEGIAGIELRLHAYKRHHGLSDAEVTALPFGYLAANVNLRDSEKQKGQLIEILQTFEAQCGVKLGLVVIDTLARAMAGGNENAAEDIGAYVRTSDEIREATGAHIMHIHHLGKDASKGARGSSALRAAVDTELIVTTGGKENVHTISATKQRDLIGGAKGEFRLVPVEIGTDRDGDEVVSCTVHQCSQAEADHRPQKLEGNEQKALDLLASKIAKEGVEALPSTGLPPGIRVFPKEAWREAGEEALSNGSQATRERVFRKVHSALIAKNHISEGGGFVWINP
ncbi:MAG: bifunctional DNA primase/polymerase [Leptospirillia bacterium]